MTTSDNTIVLIGVGNIYCGDDGAGPAVAAEVASFGLPAVRIIDQVGDGTDLISAWEGAHAAIVVDCMKSGAAPGTIRRFDGLADSIDEELFPGYSTHAFNITEIIRLARVLGRLPERLIIFGIEGRTFSTGTDMSMKIKTEVKSAVRLIKAEIEAVVSCIRIEGTL